MSLGVCGCVAVFCLVCLSSDGMCCFDLDGTSWLTRLNEIQWNPSSSSSSSPLKTRVHTDFNIQGVFLVLILVTLPRVFNRFVEFLGSCGVNYPRVKSRVWIKMWAQCQMHSHHVKCHNTPLPSLSCLRHHPVGGEIGRIRLKIRSLLLVSTHGSDLCFCSLRTLPYSINFATAPNKTSPLVSLVPFFCSPARTDLFNSLSPPASSLEPHSARLDSDNK